MIQIRQGLFETNSSSVHVLVIPKDTEIIIPQIVYLRGGEYGWSSDEEYDTMSYFYEACLARGQEEVNKLVSYLKRKGVEEVHCARSNGYIDHSNEVPLDTLFRNENLLDRFLFGRGSFVETGNDNSDSYPSCTSYDQDKYDTIKKGN